MILADTLIGYIPEIGPWLDAFLDISVLTQGSAYKADITKCVENFIEQDLDKRVLRALKPSSATGTLLWLFGMILPLFQTPHIQRLKWLTRSTVKHSPVP